MTVPILDKKVFYGILIILGIHSGGLILTSILNNFYAIFIPYEYLPWTRLIVVAAEIFLGVHYLQKLTAKPGLEKDRDTMIRVLAIAVALFIGSHFRGFLDVSKPFYCAYSVFDGMADMIYNTHALQKFIVDKVEAMTLGMTVFILGIWNWKE